MTDTSAAPAQADALSGKLHSLALLRGRRDADKEAARRSEWEYRNAEREVIETMLDADPPLTSIKVAGIGTFIVQSRSYVNPTDYTAVLPWAAADGLISMEPPTCDINGNDEFIVRFGVESVTDDDTGETVTRLVSGAFKLDASKATLAEHARERLDSDGELLPGLKTSTTSFIQIRAQK